MIDNSFKNKLNDVVILAGGFGTRLKSIIGSIPKPMALIGDIPLLEHQIMLCKKYGFVNILILVHYQADTIINYFGDGKNFDVNITYRVESVPRGTAGAVLDSLHLLSDNFLVLYGDTFLEVNLRKFFNLHSSSFPAATLFIHPNSHPYDSDLVEIDSDANIIEIHCKDKNRSNLVLKNLVNAALYIINKNEINKFKFKGDKIDFMKDIFPELLNSSCTLKGYLSAEYIKDMGTPDRYEKVNSDYNFGLHKILSSENPKKAVFLDRDGTLNILNGYINSIEQITLIDGVSKAINKLNSSGFLSLCITNQPVIARGEASFSDIYAVNNKLESLLGEGGAYLDGLYFCPHHPDSGYSGEVVSLKINCNCRKPNTGLIDSAVNLYDINKENSWFIGDSTSDILAGKNAGLKTILLQTGSAGKDGLYKCNPDYIFYDLNDAVDWIVDGNLTVKQKISKFLPVIFKSRVILVGGLARSGKTIFSSALVDVLRFYGFTAHHISIDSWLKPIGVRSQISSVIDRYYLDEFYKLIEPIANSSVRRNLHVPQIDRLSGSESKPLNISIGPKDIMIIEGVPALLSFNLRCISSLSFYIETCDIKRNLRFLKEYKLRGLDDISIAKLISSRFEEVELIKSSITTDDIIIKI